MTFQEEIKQRLRSDLEPGVEYIERPEVYEEEIRSGVRWQISRYEHKLLDEFCPYKQGQLTCIIGHTNVGKTTLILYLLSQLLKDKKVLIYSAENRISQIARYLIQFYHKSKIYENYFGWLRDRVKFIKHCKQFTYKDMLEQMAVVQDNGFDADIIFIDPYNSLKKEGNSNGHEYHYEAMEEMRIYTMQSGKSIFLNCHTVTESQRIKANEYGEIPPPRMGDVEGGAKFPNKADDVWVIHRNLYHVDEYQRYISKLYVGKVRNTEGGGRPTGWNEPIDFIFNRDWLGFTNPYDEKKVSQFETVYNEPEEKLPF